MRDKRKYPRIPAPISVDIYIGDEKETVWKGSVKDISEKGLCFEAKNQLNLKDKVILSFKLPGGKQYCLIGEIVHAKTTDKKVGHGAKYYMADLKERRSLREYIVDKMENKMACKKKAVKKKAAKKKVVKKKAKKKK